MIPRVLDLSRTDSLNYARDAHFLWPCEKHSTHPHARVKSLTFHKKVLLCYAVGVEQNVAKMYGVFAMNACYLLTPAVRARWAIAFDLRYTPLYQKVVLDQFDAMLTGQPTPFFDRYPELRMSVLQQLNFYKERAFRLW